MGDGSPYGERFVTNLRSCIEGIGTDELGICGLLLHCDTAAATKAYETKYSGRKLHADLESDTNDVFTTKALQTLVVGMVAKPAWLWAQAFHYACNGRGGLHAIGTDEYSVINILCVNRDSMPAFRKAFEDRGGLTLIDEIEDETSDSTTVFRELLKLIIQEKDGSAAASKIFFSDDEVQPLDLKDTSGARTEKKSKTEMPGDTHLPNSIP